ncbi:HTH domain-containing protein [Mucilaginibacter conchicola]|uniref:HTH domain-containing protein n=1 Tax=Mucilaginibacter conchicola TaxID=2303333 RepID=A0A372NQ92_9SPHI|nr:HTH domain-containing protein [Mucilaginibacter conchicola]
MDFRTYEQRLDYILELLQKGRFRSLGDTASRFDCSTRTIKRMLNHLRERGHDITYDRLQKKYFLKKEE